MKTIINLKTKYAFLLSIIILLSSMICGCTLNSRIEPLTQNGVYFDTLISITVYDKSPDNARMLLNNCLALCDKYEKMFNANLPESDIYAINNSNGDKITVSSETLQLIKIALQYSDTSNGLFDITINKATSLWDFHKKMANIPTNSELAEAVSHINYNNLKIDESSCTVELADTSSQIDIGGIAKGYIADQIASYLASTNVNGAVINIGGDVVTLGHKSQDQKFNIGITDPFESKTPIINIEVTDKAIATSGTYERAFTYNDITYHHILNPNTGMPIDTDVISATIITDHGIDADTLATIAILLGSTKAIDYINTIPNTEGIIICTNGDILYTNNASSYIRSR